MHHLYVSICTFVLTAFNMKVNVTSTNPMRGAISSPHRRLDEFTCKSKNPQCLNKKFEERPLEASCYLQMYGGLCVHAEQHGVCTLEPPNVFHPSPIPYCSVAINARSVPIIYGKFASGAAEHKFNATLGITSITCPESRLHEIISGSC